MVSASVLITSPKWLSLLLFALAAYQLFLYLYWVPHQQVAINIARSASFASIFYVSIFYPLLAFQLGVNTNDPTQVWGSKSGLNSNLKLIRFSLKSSFATSGLPVPDQLHYCDVGRPHPRCPDWRRIRIFPASLLSGHRRGEVQDGAAGEENKVR